MPLICESALVPPVVLPRLVYLRLCGAETVIAGLMGLISMSSPLHNVIIRFKLTYSPSEWTLTDAVKKILTSYYECQGLDYPCEVNCLTISSNS